jgi:hypothetical protein
MPSKHFIKARAFVLVNRPEGYIAQSSIGGRLHSWRTSNHVVAMR